MPCSRSHVDGTRSATITVPRWAPTASSDSPSTGTCETRWSTPSISRVPDQLAPLSTRGLPSDHPAALDRRVGGDAHVEVGLGEAHRRDPGLGHEALGQGGEPGAGLGLGQVGAHQGAHGDLLGQAGDAPPLDALEGGAGLGERHPRDGDQDDDDDRELEGEELPRQRRATSPARDHYELNLLC